MAFRAHLALLVSLVCLAVAVPADFGSAQFLLPPADIGNGKNLRRVQPPPQQRRGGFLEMLFGPRPGAADGGARRAPVRYPGVHHR
jgi:hypothetical protein